MPSGIVGTGARLPAFPHDDNRFRATPLIGPVFDGSGNIIGWQLLGFDSSGNVVTGNPSTVTATAVAVNTTPTLLAAANPARKKLVISNFGPNPISVGGPTVTTATGTPVAATNGQLVIDGFTGAIFAVTTALQVTPADTRILQIT